MIVAYKLSSEPRSMSPLFGDCSLIQPNPLPRRASFCGNLIEDKGWDMVKHSGAKLTWMVEHTIFIHIYIHRWCSSGSIFSTSNCWFTYIATYGYMPYYFASIGGINPYGDGRWEGSIDHRPQLLKGNP